MLLQEYYKAILKKLQQILVTWCEINLHYFIESRVFRPPVKGCSSNLFTRFFQTSHI